MAGVGGYQRPSNPAAGSGVGAASQRTDGGPTVDPSKLGQAISGEKYGQNGPLNAIRQEGNQMAQANSQPVYGGDLSQFANFDQAVQGAAPFLRESENPNEDLSAGANWGAGNDFNSLGLAGNNPDAQQNKEALLGLFATLKPVIENGNASPATRALYLRVATAIGSLEN